MMQEGDFKELFYKNYRATHNAHLYGEISLPIIRRSFSVWRHYYQSHLPDDKDASILELGCGDGAFVYFLQQDGYTNVDGIDVSAEQIAVGQGLGIENIEVADINELLDIDSGNRYDLIIARDVIEHFSRQDAFDMICRIHKALREGGKFIMQVPNGEGIYSSSIYYGDYTHEMAYTVSSVRQLFLNVGFAKSHCHPTGPVPHSIRGACRKLLWSCKVAHHRFWKMVETGNPSGIFTSNLIAIGEKR